MRKLRYFPVWLSIGWLLVAAVIVLSLLPGVPAVGPSDKLNHLLAYAVLMSWFGGIYARRQHLGIAVRLMMLGIILEGLQALSGHRHMEALDAVANVAGVALAWAIMRNHLNTVLFWCEARLQWRTS